MGGALVFLHHVWKLTIIYDVGRFVADETAKTIHRIAANECKNIHDKQIGAQNTGKKHKGAMGSTERQQEYI